MSLDKKFLQAKAYRYLCGVMDNYIPLKKEVIITIIDSKNFDIAQNALYSLCEVDLNDGTAKEYHHIRLSLNHHFDNDINLFDSIAHELVHCGQVESGLYDEGNILPHDTKFFITLNEILKGSNLPNCDKDYIKACTDSDKGV